MGRASRAKRAGGAIQALTTEHKANVAAVTALREQNDLIVRQLWTALLELAQSVKDRRQLSDAELDLVIEHAQAALRKMPTA